MSVLTLGEIRKGIASLASAKKRKVLGNWLDKELMARFAGRILPVSDEVALAWADLQGRVAKRGSPAPVVDALVAATAIVNECAVVTRDEESMPGCEAKVVNPWEGKAQPALFATEGTERTEKNLKGAINKNFILFSALSVCSVVNSPG